MVEAFIGMGSDIDPANNLQKALELLSREVRISAVSTVYRTAPIGEPGKDSSGRSPFLNCVVLIRTQAPPLELKYKVLRKIESALGRIRGTDKYASRTIDLDLIIYDNVLLQQNGLTIPDPLIERRSFLAIALAEIAPERILPGTDRRIGDIALSMPRVGMEPVIPMTDILRKRISHEC